jgi:hypothetical protein
MAVRSRRFIAIAGPAATPVVFLMILHIWNMFTSRFTAKKNGILEPVRIKAFVQHFIYSGTVLVILGFGMFWGLKYKRIYLDPWPTSDRYTSVFMRMTASHLKPFDVCKFINDNQLSGRIFNYWTEGGAVAFGQKPDPKTGQIRLKLFMDGRAQAAYDHEKFRLWQHIFSGGPHARKAMRKEGKITTEKLKTIGQWINKQLNKYDAWVTLMPKTQDNSTYMRALKETANWKTAYLDDTQHLMVNIDTPKGKELIEQILKNEAKFPNAYSENMTRSIAIIENSDREQFNELYPLVKKAFTERKTPSSSLALARLAGFVTNRPKITEDFEVYLSSFSQNQGDYKKQDGYYLRLVSAEICSRLLSRYDSSHQNKYKELSRKYANEIKVLNQNYIW